MTTSKPSRRRPIILALAAVLGLCLIVCVVAVLVRLPSSTSSSSATAAPVSRTVDQVAAITETPQVAPTPVPTLVPVPTAAPVILNGTGKRVAKLDLGAGLAVFAMKHAGQHNFSIILLAPDGGTVDLLVNEIGAFSGSTAVAIPHAGTYALNVDADGAWQVKATQPTPDPALLVSSPVKVEGKGPSVSQFLQLSGLTTFDLKHSGQHNFAVILMKPDGSPVDLIVNEIGAFDGQQALGLQAGTYLLKVEADGSWSISID